MKYFLLIAAISTTIFAACNNSNNTPSKGGSDSVQTKQEMPAPEAKSTTPVKDILAGYIQLKNALAGDNGNDASTAGNTMVESFKKFNKSALTIFIRKKNCCQ